MGWSALDWIAEQRIEQAIERGELSNLPGEGKPLPADLDPLIPEEMRNVVRVLRRAGGLPVAFENLREHKALELRLAGAKGEERRMLLAQMAVLKARLERDGLRRREGAA